MKIKTILIILVIIVIGCIIYAISSCVAVNVNSPGDKKTELFSEDSVKLK